jgi:DNA primase
MSGVSDHTIDRIRDAVNIVDLVSRYVNLKKSGRNYLGLCPFHKEKTPSFSVSPEKQIYHCFGCGSGGNVFSFLMEYEKINFFDALRRLAEETGIELELAPKEKEMGSENEQLLEFNQIAASFFIRNLNEGPKSLQTYLKKRGISAEFVKKMSLGYTPKEWDKLYKHIKHFRYPLEPFTNLGLILESDKKSKYYDRFRDRLMFPIHNLSGKIVGFGGRDLSGDQEAPKYINSPESPVYQKSKELYGLYFARDAIRKAGMAIFVEGYMDWIQLYQNGIENVVATSGTSLTDDHARIIRRYAQNICLCYDSDTAGINAAARGGEILFQNNVEVKVLLLPEGQDPDSYVKEKRADAFYELIKNATDYFSFRMDKIQQVHNLQNAQDRSLAVNEILEILAPLKDNVKVGFYVERISENWDVPNTLLFNELRGKRRNLRRRDEFRDERIQQVRQARTPLVFNGAWSAEKDLLLILMTYYTEVKDFVVEHIQVDDFLNNEMRDVFKILCDYEEESMRDLHQFVLDKLENQTLRDLFTKDLFQDFKDPARYLQDCIRQIKIAKYQSFVDAAGKKLRAMKPSDPDYLILLENIREYMQERKKWQDVKIEIRAF